MNQHQSTPSPKKNIAKEIKSITADLKNDSDKITEYKLAIRNLNSQRFLPEYHDMLEMYENRKNENKILLEQKKEELKNHPLNRISPSRKNTKKRKRSHSHGGTRRHRRKSVHSHRRR